ncbi:FecR family protein [Spirosoma linguale]|uniref:Anti-FecI sigma factor, FecR n=1 Tax=Spirosoma linguale (strain ATCC 33905 / DSM 74 / LMG 10896 / Claus 1) TaxID=504472 RepID=D2QTW2_SPILD|nr:anti-FecI sigma factor, FecR [Spirosoma linguale DSM 74]
METKITKELVVNHFARKVSPLQRELIAQWLQDKANEEKYYEWLEEWENRNPQYRTQTDNAIQQYAAFLTGNPHLPDTEAPVSELTIVRPNRWRQWLVAASVMLLLGAGIGLFRNQILYKNYTTAFGETQALTLTDGSRVTLNANSSLRVPRWGFGKSNREVFLAGEASFSVTHTPDDRKFIVRTAKKLDIIVLGTEFTVFARKRGARVVLNKGKVQLRYQEGKTARQLLMKPGDLVTLDTRNHMALNPVKQSRFRSVSEEKRFVFEETTLEEVAYLLEDNYGLQVEIKNHELAERVLMGSFRADNVDQLLQSISELLDVNVVRQGQRVQIMDN